MDPNSWNPFETMQYNWSNPFQNPVYDSETYWWTPDFGGQGAQGFVNSLNSTDELESASAWEEYAIMLGNMLTTRGMFTPDMQDVYYQSTAPAVGHDPQADTTSLEMPGVGDSQAMNWNSTDYWNKLETDFQTYLGNSFGDIDVDSEGRGLSNNPFVSANSWLNQVVDMGRKYAWQDPSQRWSTARDRDRNRAWSLLEGTAGSYGLGDDILRLGRDIFNTGFDGPMEPSFSGSDGFDDYLGNRGGNSRNR